MINFKTTISRIYVKVEDEKNLTITYYDYANLNEDGSNFVHIISFVRDKRKLFNKVYRETDDKTIYLNDVYRLDNGWDALKKYLKDKNVKYSYKKIKLSKEERLNTQQKQSSVQRGIHIASLAEKSLSDYMSLNEYERKVYLRECKELFDSYDEGNETHYELSVDYDDDEFMFMYDKLKFEDDLALEKCKNLDSVEILDEYNKLPKAIKPFANKWKDKAKVSCKNLYWYAKCADFSFIYNNKKYMLCPSALGLDDTEVDHICGTIKKDLMKIGCKCIEYYGMLD